MTSGLLQKQGGFSLLEVVLVVAILALVGVAGAAFYQNFFKDIQLESSAKNIIAGLRNARAKSMLGEDDLKWGVNFVNSTTSDDYYELFSTPSTYGDASTTIEETTFLPPPVNFSSPASGATTTVIFSKITATTTLTTVTITSDGDSKTITVESQGGIY